LWLSVQAGPVGNLRCGLGCAARTGEMPM